MPVHRYGAGLRRGELRRGVHDFAAGDRHAQAGVAAQAPTLRAGRKIVYRDNAAFPLIRVEANLPLAEGAAHFVAGAVCGGEFLLGGFLAYGVSIRRGEVQAHCAEHRGITLCRAEKLDTLRRDVHNPFCLSRGGREKQESRYEAEEAFHINRGVTPLHRPA